MNGNLPLPIIYTYRCDGCGACVQHCPTQSLGLHAQSGRATLARPDLCTYCTHCEESCPTQAIMLPFLVVFDEQRPRALPASQ